MGTADETVKRSVRAMGWSRCAVQVARLRSDLSHHANQHKLLQARVDELEDELDKARHSVRRSRSVYDPPQARKDREFHAARVRVCCRRSSGISFGLCT